MLRCAACGQENPEGFRFCGQCGSPLAAGAAAPREVRKTVTVVFCDVTGSTALGDRVDPETLRRAMGRWFEAARAAVERHGGTVEKFVGDAVMAVFGIPTLHEDDALRAVRAAIDMREALETLNTELGRDYGLAIEVRTGVNTGEVVAGEGETLATGDAVNVGARLEQAAQPGEILIGASTHRLVRNAVRAEPVEPVSAKGKVDPVAAYRLVEVLAGAEAFARHLDSPMVGREGELAQLRGAYERAVREKTAYLFTLLGPAGIGKSRLVLEFLDRAGSEATVLTGRCLPYGEGITYWPLVEILHRAAHHEARARIVELLSGETDAELIADWLSAAIGEGEAAGAAEETAWAARKLFERLARDRPLVVVFDDLQWAEPTFLDLVEHVADWSREAPILLLCVARPELFEARQTWGGGKLNATALLLEPLSEVESGRLVDELLAQPRIAPELRARIIAAAEGNPLYVEQMLAMTSEDEDGGAVPVPPTIQALLAARLERLSPPERAALERASVVGKEFSRDDVAALSGGDEAGPDLLALVRKELIRTDRDDGFHFRHLLIRDAAYEAMPKEVRADLHERYGDRLEGTSGERLRELEEIVGYHLEQAFRYRSELALPDEGVRALGARAAERLASAGRRALGRGDMPAAANLLERAASLLATGRARLEILLDLVDALVEAGEIERVERTLTEIDSAGDPALARATRLKRLQLGTLQGSISTERGLAEAEALVRELEREGDTRRLAEAHNILGRFRFWLGDPTGGIAEHEQALREARRAGDHRQRTEARWWIALELMWGPESVPAGVRRCRELLAEGSDSAVADVLIPLGALEAMGGDLAGGRQTLARGRRRHAELGRRVTYATTSQPAGLIELLAGDGVRAEGLLQKAYEILDEVGERGYFSTVAGILALALCEQGRFEEAELYAGRGREAGASDDITTQIACLTAMAWAHAGRGGSEAGLSLAREALTVGRSSDFDEMVVLPALAGVFEAAGEPDQARELLARAIAVFERKGCVLGLDRVRERLAALQSPSSSA